MVSPQLLLTALAAAGVSAFPAAGHAVTGGKSAVKQLFQFQNGSWLENLAVRSNGNILATRLDVPEVYEFAAPTYSSAKLVHRFPGYLAALGITETKHDIFAVNVGNVTQTPSFASQKGSYAVWTLDFTSKAKYSTSLATARKVADLPELGIANGIVYLPAANSVLISNTIPGNIWRVDLNDGKSELAVDDPLFRQTGFAGINGLKISGNTVYFTNSNTGLVGSLPINDKTGKAVGKVRSISTINGTGFPIDDLLDDLALGHGNRFLYATGAVNNTVIQIDNSSGSQKVIAGGLNSTEIVEPTAAAFGRRAIDSNVLYVVGGGGVAAPVNGTTVVGAQLVAIDLTAINGRQY